MSSMECYWHGEPDCDCRGVETVADLIEAIHSCTLYVPDEVHRDACKALSDTAESLTDLEAQPQRILHILDAIPRGELAEADDRIRYIYDDYRYYRRGT